MKKEIDFSLTSGSWLAILITGSVTGALGVLTLAVFPTGFYLNMLPGQLWKFVVILTWANFIYLLSDEGRAGDIFLGLFPVMALALTIEPQPDVTGTGATAIRCVLGLGSGLCLLRWMKLAFTNLEHRVRSASP